MSESQNRGAGPPPGQARPAKKSGSKAVIVGVVALVLPMILMGVIGIWWVSHTEPGIKANFRRVQQAEDAAAAEQARQHKELSDRMVAHFQDCLNQKKYDDAAAVLENMRKAELDDDTLAACAGALEKARGK